LELSYPEDNDILNNAETEICPSQGTGEESSPLDSEDYTIAVVGGNDCEQVWQTETMLLSPDDECSSTSINEMVCEENDQSVGRLGIAIGLCDDEEDHSGELVEDTMTRTTAVAFLMQTYKENPANSAVAVKKILSSVKKFFDDNPKERISND
jgi:hypothetical protein